MAAIGRMVVEAATLEYSAAVLVAATEGLRDEACEERALAIVKNGEARRQRKSLAEKRPDLSWLMNETEVMLRARHFVAHAIVQQDAVAGGQAALFIIQPRHGESMITTAQARNNARLIREGRCRIQDAIAAEISGSRPG